MKSTERTVIVLIDLKGGTSRDFLSGILKYCSHYTNWALKLAAAEDLDNVLGGTKPGSGLIMTLTSGPIRRLVRRRPDLKIVDLFPRDNLTASHVRDDHASIARIGYQHLRSLGSHRSYAYVPSEVPSLWSDERQREFERLVISDGNRPFIYSPSADSPPELRSFVRELPKPAAVFCAYDIQAQAVIEAARHERISIPGELAVLGVDNDEFVCETTHPKISSVRADHIGVGYCLAQELDKLFRARKRRIASHTVRCPAIDVIVRETTAPVAQASGYLINRAHEFVGKHASERLTVSDVARHLGVSQRLLELRFAEYSHETVASAIRRARLEKAKSHLVGTTLSVREIARQLGFRNSASFNNIFTREVGQPPGEYRRAHADESCVRRPRGS